LDFISLALKVLDSIGTALKLNHGTLKGIGVRLNMLKTLVESISPQTINSRKELKAF
jgi:mevalonate kinase